MRACQEAFLFVDRATIAGGGVSTGRDSISVRWQRCVPLTTLVQITFAFKLVTASPQIIVLYVSA